MASRPQISQSNDNHNARRVPPITGVVTYHRPPNRDIEIRPPVNEPEGVFTTQGLAYTLTLIYEPGEIPTEVVDALELEQRAALQNLMPRPPAPQAQNRREVPPRQVTLSDKQMDHICNYINSLVRQRDEARVHVQLALAEAEEVRKAGQEAHISLWAAGVSGTASEAPEGHESMPR